MSSTLVFLGSTECEQAGDPDLDDAVLTKPRPLHCFSDVKLVVCGALHTLVVLDSGLLYAWGCNDSGAVGVDSEVPARLDFPGVVLTVSAGDNHSLAIVQSTHQREVYWWGTFRVLTNQNLEGEMCASVREPALLCPREFFDHKPIKVVSGANHALLLAHTARDKGKIYAWGDCNNGKIGRLPPVRNRNARALRLDSIGSKAVADVWACGNHSFYKDLSGRLFGWGLNRDGQLGLPHTQDVMKPEEVLFFRDIDIVQVVGGEFHSLFLDCSGQVFGAGVNKDGQLGIDNDLEATVLPVTLEIPELVKTLRSSCDYAYALTEGGCTYSWGSGLNYVLGNGSERTQLTPTLVELEFQPKDIAAGAQHVFFLMTES